MFDFQLFRLKVYFSPQPDLFIQRPSRSQIIEDAIKSRPAAQLRKGIEWHIGNILEIDKQGLYFRVGRSSRTKVAIFKDGDFVDVEEELAPYTHVVVDVRQEILALARNSNVSSTPVAIARAIARLLDRSSAASELSVKFEMAEISDPHEFIRILREAYAITRFTVSFAPPNPWDVNKDIIEPLQKTLATVDADTGQLEYIGDGLRVEACEELAHSAAASGDDAKAKIRPEHGTRPVLKRLRGNVVTMSHDKVDSVSTLRNLLSRMRELYARIRGSSGDGQE